MRLHRTSRKYSSALVTCGTCLSVTTLALLAGCQAPSSRQSLPEPSGAATDSWSLPENDEQTTTRPPELRRTLQEEHGWASALNDPTLLKDLHIAIGSAPRIEAARQRVLARGAQVDQSQAELMPQVIASADIGRKRRNDSTSSDFAINALASWELDWAGGKRAQRDADQAAQRVAAAELGALQLSQAADLTAAWLDFVHAREQIALYRQLQQVIEREIATWSGVQADTGDPLSQIVLISRRATKIALIDRLITWQQRREEASAAYATILGSGGVTDLPGTEKLPKAPSFHQENLRYLPSAVLARRPDVAQARFAFYQGRSLADVRWAERWPTIAIGAEVGYASNTLDTLISPEQFISRMFAGLIAPVFDAGRRRHAQNIAEAESQALLSDYQQAVAKAWQATRRALIAAAMSHQGLQELSAEAKTSDRRADVITGDWQAGLVPTTDYYATRRLAIEANIAAAAARHRAWTDWLILQRELARPAFPSAPLPGPISGPRPQENEEAL